jgi:hypothetical protein
LASNCSSRRFLRSASCVCHFRASSCWTKALHTPHETWTKHGIAELKHGIPFTKLHQVKALFAFCAALPAHHCWASCQSLSLLAPSLSLLN